MGKEDLIKKLENIKTPEIEIQSHKERLKVALLNSRYFKEEKIMNPIMFWTKRLIPAGFILALIFGVGFAVIEPKLQIAKAMEIAKKDPQIQKLMKDYGVEIKQVKLKDGKAYVLLGLPEEKLPSGFTKGRMQDPGLFFIAFKDPKTGEIKEISGSVAEIDLKKRKVGKLELIEKEKINLTPLTEEEKAKAIEVAKSEPKIQEMIPDLEESEVDVKPLPPFKLRLEEDPDEGIKVAPADSEKIVNVIFKSRENEFVVTVNLTENKVIGVVSISTGKIEKVKKFHNEKSEKSQKEFLLKTPNNEEIIKEAVKLVAESGKIPYRCPLKLMWGKIHFKNEKPTEVQLTLSCGGKVFEAKVDWQKKEVISLKER